MGDGSSEAWLVVARRLCVWRVWTVVAWGPGGGGLGCGCLLDGGHLRGLDNGGLKALESGSEAWVLVSRDF